MKFIELIGRVFYSLIFINSGVSHFSSASVDYANSQGVPLSTVLVPASGVMAIVGGLSILLGYKTELGAWIVVAFLIPVTLMMHAFWKMENLAEQHVQMAMFMKNISMLGAALLITWFGAGPVSIDARIKTRHENDR